MKLKNIVIVVKDIEKSEQFTCFQDGKIWQGFLGKDIIPKNHSCELYFEESDIEAFVQKLEKRYPSVQYVNRLMTHSWGQKVIRFYDPDGNLIEVGTPMR